MSSLLDELKRRKVFRVAAIYAVVAWVLIEIADVVLPTFGTPLWVNQTLIFLFVLGFPLAILLAWAYEITPDGVRAEGTGNPAPAPAPSSDRMLIYATFVLVLFVAGFQVAERFLGSGPRDGDIRQAIPSSSVMRSEITVDELLARRFTRVRSQMGISPDGSHLVYGDLPPGGELALKIRNIATGETSVLMDPAPLGTIPEFSPDGQRVLINGGPESFLIVSISSGTMQSIAAPEKSGGAGGNGGWLNDDEILYTGQSTLNKISLASGAVELLATAPSGRLYKPHALPGGAAILVTSNQVMGESDFNSSSIALVELESGSIRPLVNGGYLPQYAESGHIVFIRNGDLWAVPFDLASLQTVGAEVRVIEGIDSQPQISIASFALSDSGRLIYLPGPENSNTTREFSWFDRSGNEVRVDLPPGDYLYPSVSPDGRYLALSLRERVGSIDIWLHEFATGNTNRRTFVNDARKPVWSPDGTRLAYYRSEGYWMINADGSGQPELIMNSSSGIHFSFTPEEGNLIYMDGEPDSEDLYTLAYRDSTWMSSPLIQSPNRAVSGMVSPDGRWLAYSSNETGRWEIFVSPYPDTSRGKWQVTTNNGTEPLWGPNSDELFYLVDVTGQLMSVAINAGPNAISAGNPQYLGIDFLINFFDRPNFSISPDGQRFLGTRRGLAGYNVDELPAPATFVVVENWFEELSRLAPSEADSE